MTSAAKHLTCLLDYQPSLTHKLTFPWQGISALVNSITRVDHVIYHTEDKSKKWHKIVQQLHNVLRQLYLNKVGEKIFGH